MIKLGGGEHELRFDWAAIRRFERESGVGYKEAFERLEKGHVGLIVDLVWAGLLHKIPDLKISTVEGWLNAAPDIESIAAEIGERGAAAFEKKSPKTPTTD